MCDCTPIQSLTRITSTSICSIYLLLIKFKDMDKFEVLDVIKALDEIGNKKRFSKLSHQGIMIDDEKFNALIDLLQVWTDITQYIEKQLSATRVLSNQSLIVLVCISPWNWNILCSKS